MSGNAPAPRATGGQTRPAAAIAIGQQRREAHQQVQRTARPIGDEHQDRRHAPRRRRGRGRSGGARTGGHAPDESSDGPTGRPRRKYRRAWDRRVIATHGPVANMPVPHRSHRGGTEQTEGHVGHGRPGAARITGTRAIVSRRLVLPPARGGLRGRDLDPRPVPVRPRPGRIRPASRRTPWSRGRPIGSS